MTDLFFTAFELGLLYSFLVYGVFLTFRVLDFADLSVDGSLVTGAACAALAIKAGVPGLPALLIGAFAGAVAGGITALLHTRLGIGKILSGILALGMIYTINLRLMDGPNIALLNQPNIIPWLRTPLHHPSTILFLLLLVLGVKLILDWFLQTELGLAIRATGDNENTVKSLGINPRSTKLIALIISHALVGLSGALIAQYQGFVDINMGIGVIILGIAALMIGEALVLPKRIAQMTVAVFVGVLVYELVITLALRIGLAPTDLKFVTSLIVILALVFGGSQSQLTYGKRRVFSH